MADHPMIELRGLHRFFGSLRAVNGISFAVEKGHVFGYIGPNGAGKTTSMRILSTLELPTFGDAFVDGFSVIDDPDHVRRRLGFMPDAFTTYANTNVREYLDFFARAYGLRGEQRLSAIDRVMQFTGLNVMAEKPVDGLSKGMKQRLCLGRTIIHDPAVLILDEPAAGLDPRARIELREMIRQLAAEGKTILISSHILSELAEMCDVVGIIERGQLLAVGSVDAIKRQQQQHSAVLLEARLLPGTAPAVAAQLISNRPSVREVRIVEPDGVIFLHEGEAVDQAEILRQLVQAGVPVLSFASKTTTLEEVFLQVTKGQVQ